MSEWLSRNVFQQGILVLPLVSIDLVIRDPLTNKYLLGMRKNRPAKNYWFVPGGRIRKNERLEVAFSRITENEIGHAVQITSAIIKGHYEHFYDDCVFGEKISTHYIVLAYELSVERCKLTLPAEQHGEYTWLDKGSILDGKNVHPYSKEYFL